MLLEFGSDVPRRCRSLFCSAHRSIATMPHVIRTVVKVRRAIHSGHGSIEASVESSGHHTGLLNMSATFDLFENDRDVELRSSTQYSMCVLECQRRCEGSSLTDSPSLPRYHGWQLRHALLIVEASGACCATGLRSSSGSASCAHCGDCPGRVVAALCIPKKCMSSQWQIRRATRRCAKSSMTEMCGRLTVWCSTSAAGLSSQLPLSSRRPAVPCRPSNPGVE